MKEFVAHEPPWLLAKIDQRVAAFKAEISAKKAVNISDYDTLVMPLTEPPEGATRQRIQMWERTCDNCGRFCPGGLNAGHAHREWDGLPVLVFFGACNTCLPVEQ